jgi:hypothetical protein
MNFSKAVVTCMTLIEPAEVYACRTAPWSTDTNRKVAGANSATQSRELNAPLRFADGWDERILLHVSNQSEPVRIVSLASQLRKCVRHRDRQHKEVLKRKILVRVGVLIRAGMLARVRRKYVVARRS